MAAPDLPALAASARERLGYFRNARRAAGVTCSVCMTFVSPGAMMCEKCADRHRTHGSALADSVGAMVYAWLGATSGKVLENYKGRSGPVILNDLKAMTLLTTTTVWLHGRCLARMTEHAVTHWACVPSLRGRENHPLRSILQAITQDGQPELPLSAAPGVGPTRITSPALFTAPPLGDGAHIVIADDAWVSGGHAQSAALTVRAAGAERVSILAMSRWLDEGREHTQPHISSLKAGPDFDPDICPWTGGACPA